MQNVKQKDDEKDQNMDHRCYGDVVAVNQQT